MSMKKVILLVVLVLLAAAFFYMKPADPELDDEVNLTLVVMTRDVMVNKGIVFGGPIKSTRYNVTLPLNTTIKELKSIVYKFTNLSHYEQKTILYKGADMDTGKTLAYYNVTDCSRIHIMTEYVI